jgi:hypothetical protein
MPETLYPEAAVRGSVVLVKPDLCVEKFRSTQHAHV